MEGLLELAKTDNFILWSTIINIILFFCVIILLVTVIKMNNKYIKFMKKLGKGSNLDEMLRKYLDEVSAIKQDNSEIKAYYTKLDYDIGSGIQKVGLVRYNAFQNVGSDLSFALALLDRENNGIVLNGLYGSESSNIYAKPIQNGTSTYKLSQEEEEAIKIASQDKGFVTKFKENKF